MGRNKLPQPYTPIRITIFIRRMENSCSVPCRSGYNFSTSLHVTEIKIGQDEREIIH